ncbi:MAG: hypothetical protein QM820_45910 [Minicystis sp.]
MDIDADCLHEARVENLERLALALGVRLPPRQGRDRQYARKLVRAVLRGLEEDRRRHRAPRPSFLRPN